MIRTPSLVTRAASTMMVGVAFFFLACQAKTVLEKPAVTEPGQTLFAEGERAFRAGDYEKALRVYEDYLEAYPQGGSVGTALFRTARIHVARHLYDKALPLLEKVLSDYPETPHRPEAHYDLALTLYGLGNYRQSEEEAVAWLTRYPENPLTGEVLQLLGRIALAEQDRPKAFSWWLKAEEAFQGSPVRQTEIGDRLAGLIEDSGFEDLKRMADDAAGSKYAPPVFHKLARFYLEGHELEQARAIAMALVRSTADRHWIDLGREMLDRIEAELSVRPGVIGCLLPLSGPFAIYGQEVLNGIQMGMDIFEESGDNQTIELIIHDTAGTPEAARSAVEELAREGQAMAIIGPLASKPSLAAARKAQEIGIPIITFTQMDAITAEGDMVFRNFLTPRREVERLLNKSMIEMRLRRFGIFYPDNPYGRFFMSLFWDKVEQMGGVIKAVESYDPGETDFETQIKKMVGLYYPRPESVTQMLNDIRALEAEQEIEYHALFEEEPEPIVDFEAVFVPDNYQQVALVSPQFPFHNVFNVRFLGTSLWQSPELLEHAADYVQGAIFPSGFFPEADSEEVKAFLENYQENFDSRPGILAATGYDTIRFLKDLIGKGEIRTRKELQSKLLESESFGGLTGRIAFDRQGEVIKDPLLLSVAGHRLTVLP